MVSRAGRMSDSELRSTLQYLQDQIDAIESLNEPTPAPTADNLLYYKQSITELAWLQLGSGLQINNGYLTVNLTGGEVVVNWGDLTGTLADQLDLQAALDAKIDTTTVTAGYQPLDADLTAIAALATTAYGRSLLTLADASAGRTSLGVVIGTDVQAYAAGLGQIGALAAPGADRILFWDHSALAWKHLTLGTNISITDTTLNVSSGTATLGDGDYGDIVASSSGTVLTIDTAAVTLAKMANIATDRLIGRDTAGTGVPEALTVGGGLEFSGSGGIQRSALTGDVTASAGSGSTTIANDAVTYAKMQNVSATDKVLGRSTSGAGDVEEIACTAAGRALLDDADASAQRTTLGLVIGTNVEAYKAGNTKVMIPFIIDGGGATITTGIKGDLGPFNFACTIDLVSALADQSGSIVVDVWKDSYANFPPTDADSITSAAPITISTATKSQDSSLTGWTKTIAVGDILRFNVDSVTSLQRVTILLSAVKT